MLADGFASIGGKGIPIFNVFGLGSITYLNIFASTSIFLLIPSDSIFYMKDF